MISRIQGRIKSKKPGKVLIEVTGGLSYEVLVPDAILRNIEKSAKGGSQPKADQPRAGAAGGKNTEGCDIDLVTYHYYQTDPSKSIPILIGFLNEIEKEFFEKFITVSGVGPKAACKALALPISEIAEAIDRADLSLLKSLPGIGEQRAKEIIAKLQGKIGKFGLIQDRFMKEVAKVGEDIKEEALSVLLQLQYRKKEAMDMIDKAIRRNPKIDSSEDLLNEVYKAKQKEKG